MGKKQGFGKRIVSAFFAAAMAIIPTISASAATVTPATVGKSVSIVWYDKNVDYSKEIEGALADGGKYALQMAVIYEQMRNAKIEDLGLDYPKWHFIRDAKDVDEAREGFKRATAKASYSDEEVDLLCRAVYAEAGSDWIPDWVQRGVTSVILNRVHSASYPNTIYSVLYQSSPCIQWACAFNGSMNQVPNQRTINNVKYVLEHGTTMPAGVTGFNSVSNGYATYAYYNNPYGYDCYFLYAG